MDRTKPHLHPVTASLCIALAYALLGAAFIPNPYSPIALNTLIAIFCVSALREVRIHRQHRKAAINQPRRL